MECPEGVRSRRLFLFGSAAAQPPRRHRMDKPANKETMARQIAHVAQELERTRTGIEPKSVSVVQSEGTLVITVHGALSPAERALSRTPTGAAQVQEFHRQLFAS